MTLGILVALIMSLSKDYKLENTTGVNVTKESKSLVVPFKPE